MIISNLIGSEEIELGEVLIYTLWAIFISAIIRKGYHPFDDWRWTLRVGWLVLV